MFSWIRKKTVLTGGLLDGTTDVCSRFLPGTGEPALSFDRTVRVLNRLESYGVERLFFTPAVRSDEKGNGAGYLSGCFERFRSGYGGGLELRLAGRYFLDPQIDEHLENGLLTYDGQHVLLEISRAYFRSCFRRSIYGVCMNGYIPVIACPERYVYLYKSDYVRMKNRDCLFQLSLSSLSGCAGSRAARRSRWLLKGGFYDFVGTDFGAASEKDGFDRLALSRREKENLKDLLIRNRALWKEVR